ncbi:MAG: hypothetical protein WAT79_14855 [Saprospiraceae bacterium]
MVPEMDDIYHELMHISGDKMKEDEMLHLIIDRVEAYLQYDRGLLLSYMYRLDIKESDIEKALFEQGDEPISFALATLILKRQLKRVETKKKYGQPPPIEGWEY